MTGLGAGDAGPTGDLQVLVEEHEPDSLPAQVGLKPSYCAINICPPTKHYATYLLGTRVSSLVIKSDSLQAKNNPQHAILVLMWNGY